MKFLLAALAAFLSPLLAQTAPITLEAENGAFTGVHIATQAAGYQGSGYVTGFTTAGDQVRWDFPAVAGVYRLGIRFRTPNGMKGFNGALNSEGFSGYFPATNSFTQFDGGLVEIASGTNTLTLGGGWYYYEIDAVTLTPESPQPPPSPGPAIPADPAATPRTQALLATIAAGYGQATISGQHGTNDFATIQAASGKLPAILEGDLIEYSPTRVARIGLPANYSESLISNAQAGHVLSVMWHWNAPAHLLDTPEQPWWRGFYTESTTFDVAAALTNPAGPEYALLLRDIDAIAVQLRKFDAAGIPILWRPLHESEGGWFWWGAKGPEPFKQLWRLLFTRLTDHHQLHNLIWVLTSEDPAWYPGNDVVDVIGVDAYPDTPGDALLPRWQPLRDRFDGVKPIALTEFGGVPDIEKMQRLGVWWAWFTSWQGNLGPASAPPELLTRTYQSNAVVTLDELPLLTEIDRNGDGVSDTEAVAIGIDPAFDLTPAITFFRENSGRFGIGYAASQIQALALGQPLLTRDPATENFALTIRLSHSPDLHDWSPVSPSSATLLPDGSLKIILPPVGDTAFFRVLGQAQ